VPLPWEEGEPSNGFSSAAGWLPQPSSYVELARKSQEGKTGSTLELYRAALKLRKELALGEGSFDWVEQEEVLSYQNGSTTISHNFGSQPKEIQGTILLRSENQEGPLQPNETVWTN
jgi:alpha-glucosidase